MVDHVIHFGDTVIGKIMNTKPQQPGPDMIMLQPFIVELNPDTLKWLNIDLNVEGVDINGNAGGYYIMTLVDPMNIIGTNYDVGGNAVTYIATSFNQNPSIFTNYAKQLLLEMKNMKSMVADLRAQNKTILEHAKHMAYDNVTLAKQYKTFIEATALDSNESMNEGEEDLESSGGDR